MARTRTSGDARQRRHLRVRTKVHGTPERPRLCVFRSSQHIYAQVIDDEAGVTLASASTLDQVVREQAKDLNKVDEAVKVGQLVAQRAAEKGIKKVVYDRGGYLYHGRVEALARGARESGLDF